VTFQVTRTLEMTWLVTSCDMLSHVTRNHVILLNVIFKHLTFFLGPKAEKVSATHYVLTTEYNYETISINQKYEMKYLNEIWWIFTGHSHQPITIHKQQTHTRSVQFYTAYVHRRGKILIFFKTKILNFIFCINTSKKNFKTITTD
jgi:hypothetical protein